MNAMDLLLSGRTIDADEAERLGLVRVLPAENFSQLLHEAAVVYAQNCSPRSMEVIKKQVIDGYEQSLSEATARAASEMFLSHASEDFKEGVAHFLERRPPAFTGQ
jgi:enoyl-CoA hydratase/carnithine racemase